jgi:glycosyltransferase involved in cell wall biosynthesis
MPKRILHIVNISFVLPYYIGEQFRYFNSLGYKISVACAPSEHFFKYAKEMDFLPYPIPIKRSFSLVADIKAIASLLRHIRRFKPQTVVGHTPKGAFIAMIAGFLAGVPNRVYFRHGLMFETSIGNKRKFLIAIERFTGALATQVICVSPSVLKSSNSLKLSAPKKNKILQFGTCNGIDSKGQFNPAKQNPVLVQDLKDNLGITAQQNIVGFVGRIVRDKGIVALLDAWKTILLKAPNSVLLLIGPYEERDAIPLEYKNYISHTPSVIQVGLIQDTAPYYALMNCFVLPSYREGFPTVVLEASAMEVPVITTKNTGCIDSIIENETGIFTDITPAAIAAAVLNLLDNSALREKLGQNGREFVVKNFEQQAIWKELEGLY